MRAVLSSIPTATIGWTLILVGCCLNVLSLEFIAKHDKGAGHLITFAQFAFIGAEGFIRSGDQTHQFDFRTRRFLPRVIPMSTYALMTSLFLSASVLNNLALDYNISIPVHTVFRSSGLAGTLITGYLMFGKRYSMHQIGSCMLVCLGVMSLTLADAHSRQLQSASCCGASPAVHNIEAAAIPSLHGGNNATDAAQVDGVALVAYALFGGGWDLRWLIGIGMLTSTLCMLAVLGHIQDRTYAKYGKVWREVMFMTHVISLPFFLFVYGDIISHARLWLDPASYPSVSLPGGIEVVTPLFLHLGINLVTQSICFKGVAILTSHTSALTCTVAMTFRKFVSLVLSIWWFQNPFTAAHWIGAALVFGGIIAYAKPDWFGVAATTTTTMTTTTTTLVQQKATTIAGSDEQVGRVAAASPDASAAAAAGIAASDDTEDESEYVVIGESVSTRAVTRSIKNPRPSSAAPSAPAVDADRHGTKKLN